MRIRDWSSDVCSSDLAKIILDLQAEINVFEMELRIIERHQLISAVGEKTDPILCPFQVHQTSLHFGMSSPDGMPVHVTGMFTPRKRSEERRVGKELVRPCRSGWSLYH